MKKIAKIFLSFGQHYYDIFGILLIGFAANIIISSAGGDDELMLFLIGLLFIFSGGIMFVLRSKCVAIDVNADAKSRLSVAALKIKTDLLVADKEVPQDIEDLASEAGSLKSVYIDREIADILSKPDNVRNVFLKGVLSTVAATAGIVFTYLYLFASPYVNPHKVIKSTLSEYLEKTTKQIRCLREDLASLSTVLNGNDTRTVNVIFRREVISEELESIRTDLMTLSALVKNLKDGDIKKGNLMKTEKDKKDIMRGNRRHPESADENR